MKESYMKGVANHPGLESCEGGRETALEAFDRGICRLGIELRKGQSGDKPMVSKYQKATRRRALARVRRSPAESKTPCMHRNSTRENGEAPWLSAVTNSGGPVGESDER
jgi:hypothetical protein